MLSGFLGPLNFVNIGAQICGDMVLHGFHIVGARRLGESNGFLNERGAIGGSRKTAAGPRIVRTTGIVLNRVDQFLCGVAPLIFIHRCCPLS